MLGGRKLTIYFFPILSLGFQRSPPPRSSLLYVKGRALVGGRPPSPASSVAASRERCALQNKLSFSRRRWCGVAVGVCVRCCVCCFGGRRTLFVFCLISGAVGEGWCRRGSHFGFFFFRLPNFPSAFFFSFCSFSAFYMGEGQRAFVTPHFPTTRRVVHGYTFLYSPFFQRENKIEKKQQEQEQKKNSNGHLLSVGTRKRRTTSRHTPRRS